MSGLDAEPGTYGEPGPMTGPGKMATLAYRTLRARHVPLCLVIFDCDVVLVDSEPVANRVVAEELTRLGWVMTTKECQVRFLGLNLTRMMPLIEAELRCPLPPDWELHMEERLVTVLAEEVELMPGAATALAETTRLGLPWRIASNSSHAELRAKFGRNGLGDVVAGRLHLLLCAFPQQSVGVNLFSTGGGSVHGPVSAAQIEKGGGFAAGGSQAATPPARRPRSIPSFIPKNTSRRG